MEFNIEDLTQLILEFVTFFRKGFGYCACPEKVRERSEAIATNAKHHEIATLLKALLLLE